MAYQPRGRGGAHAARERVRGAHDLRPLSTQIADALGRRSVQGIVLVFAGVTIWLLPALWLPLWVFSLLFVWVVALS
ncbi:MAG: hypothetical protein ACYDAZ_08690, partial [Thermoplasmataceae archaeon]